MPSSSRPIDRALEVAYDPANTGLPAAEVQSALDALNAIVAQGGNASAQGTWLISGGGVAWASGYTYRVSAAQYYIAGIAHASPQATVTLDPPDASFGRFDVIAVDDLGGVVVLEGTPSAAPELPDVDPQRQLSLTIVRVDVGTSAPPAVASRVVYAENAGPPGEWTLTASAGTITLGSTSSPHGGTKCIEATLAANGTYLEGTVAPAIVVTDSQNLVLHLRPKAAWPNQKSLSVTFRTATAQVGTAVAVANGFFGLSTALTSAYQQVVIPIAQFNLPAGTQATKVRIAVTGGGAGVGFFLDDVSLQGGVTGPGTGSTGITQQQADARYAQRSANLSDLVSAAAARAYLDLAVTYRFGVAGVVATGQKAPAHRIRVDGVAFLLDMTLAAGTATARVEASVDGGATWPTVVGSVAIAAGRSATATTSVPLAAGTLLRVSYTAASGTAADAVVSLHLRDAGPPGEGVTTGMVTVLAPLAFDPETGELSLEGDGTGGGGVATATPPLALDAGTGTLSLDESALVHRSGAETIAGVKTFAAAPLLAAGATLAGPLILEGGMAAGRVWFNSSQLVVGPTGSTAFVDLQGTPPTGIGTPSIPAGYLRVGSCIRVRASGWYDTDATSPGTLQLVVWTPGGAAGQTAPQAVGAGAVARWWEVDFSMTVAQVGPSGGVYGTGLHRRIDAAGALLAYGMIDGQLRPADTTAAIAVTMSAQFQAARPGNRIICSQFTLETLN